MRSTNFKLSIVLMMCTIMVITGCTTGAKSINDKVALKGKVEVFDRNGVKIHAYTSPEDSNLNTTYAIETEHSLVLVDAQFLVPYAEEFRKYVDSLNKPIERIIISHSHPDHHWGLDAAFGDIQVYALEETITAIREKAPGLLAARKPAMGKLAPSKIVVPQNEIETGTTEIGGVSYLFEQYSDGEDADQLVIKLPDLKVIILQDLVYNKVHLFTAANLANWISILEKLQSQKEYNLILVGHGEPTNSKIYTETIAYLQDVIEVLKDVDNAKDYAEKLHTKYSDYRGGLHKLSGSILFRKK